MRPFVKHHSNSHGWTWVVAIGAENDYACLFSFKISDYACQELF